MRRDRLRRSRSRTIGVAREASAISRARWWPALDRLQALLGGPDFEVVALSIDRNGVDAVRKFYAEVGVRNLAIHLDPSGRSIRELSTVGVDRKSTRLNSSHLVISY